MFKTPYDTTLCKGNVIEKIVKGLEEVNIQGGLWPLTSIDSSTGYQDTMQVMAIVNNVTAGAPIPGFLHPIVIENKNNPFVVIDLRHAVSFNEMQSQVTIRNQLEFSFMSYYGALVDWWVNQDPKVLMMISHLPTSLYARLISEQITRRFGLDPETQLQIAIVAAFFYCCQFEQDENVSAMDVKRFVNHISRAVFTNAEMVLNTIQDLTILNTLDDFCGAALKVTNNVRLEQLNTGLLISILANSWMGTNAGELIGVALEYPPAWLNLVNSVYRDRTYKNTTLGRLAFKDRDSDISQFLKSLSHLFIKH